jgi:CelD/BcsL family acetyltransferase involved in cellulose biosynthesis
MEQRRMTGTVVAPFDTLEMSTLTEWRALVESRGCNPSLLPDWIAVNQTTLAERGDRLEVLIDRDASGGLLSVVPYYVRRERMLRLPLKVLHLGTNLMSYHAEWLTRGEPRAALEALLDRAAGWDALYAANMLASGPHLEALRQFAADHGASLDCLPSDSSPYLTLTGSFEQLVAGQNKKSRYKLRKRQEDHAFAEGWHLEWFVAPNDVERLLGAMLHIESRSWKADAGSSIEAAGSEHTYHRELLPFLARTGMLHAAVLYRHDAPVAYSLCCLFAGWFGHLKTSFDQAFGNSSPGSYVIDASIERAIAVGAREFDFLGAAAPHKLAWTDTVREHVNVYLFAPRALPQAIGALKRARHKRAGADG